ncbi:TetR/AcrR family transcriptional regulator [Nocardiopsis oceani]
MESTSPRSSTSRERFITEAARLFAAKGYKATSVADIQVACGLTPGSGALYKHFRSKRTLLDAVVRRHSRTLSNGRSSFERELPENPHDALRLIVDETWRGIERDRELLRIILRDLDGVPDLLEEIWADIVAAVYTGLSDWLRAESAQGRIHVADPRATAAVLMGSLTYYPILDALIGHVPGDVSAESYAAAWVAHAAATLGLPPEEPVAPSDAPS